MGKSTLLKLMAGLEEVTNGDARLSPGYTVGILQEPPLDEDKTVIENIRMAFGDILAKIDRFNAIGERDGRARCRFRRPYEEMGQLQNRLTMPMRGIWIASCRRPWTPSADPTGPSRTSPVASVAA